MNVAPCYGVIYEDASDFLLMRFDIVDTVPYVVLQTTAVNPAVTRFDRKSQTRDLCN